MKQNKLVYWYAVRFMFSKMRERIFSLVHSSTTSYREVTNSDATVLRDSNTGSHCLDGIRLERY